MGKGLWFFSTTSGVGIIRGILSKKEQYGTSFNCGTTGAWGVTRFVELIPNKADSISTEFFENDYRDI